MELLSRWECCVYHSGNAWTYWDTFYSQIWSLWQRFSATLRYCKNPTFDDFEIVTNFTAFLALSAFPALALANLLAFLAFFFFYFISKS